MSSDFTPPLDAAIRHALAHLATIDTAPVGARADAATLRRRLDRPLTEQGTPATQVIDELAADVAGGLHVTNSGRFFPWVIGGALPAALAADWLTSVWDQNAHNFACSPAAAMVEEVAGKWLKEILGLPTSASFALVTGCQMAHVTCLSAARHGVLTRNGWDVESDGLYGAPPVRVISSTHAHGSIDRALRLLGLGTKHWTRIPVDDNGQLPPAALRAALESQRAPTIVILQAGDVNTGAFDDFTTLIPIAREHGAWVHVDGAFGLWVAASPTLKHFISGANAADSWATDGHKWLNVPFDCGYAFVNEPKAHAGALGLRVSYISYAAEARDESDWNPEWSRRARGFATYAALRELGRAGVRAMIERCCVHAHSIVRGIGALPGVELLWEPRINQGLVRFPSRKPGATNADHDRHNDEVIARINAGGEAFFSGTTWKGRRAMRISVTNWRTNESDVARTVAAVAAALSGNPEM
jgi:glutamate/tyrosine decarboxylase-like PLP-dependent enzyme